MSEIRNEISNAFIDGSAKSILKKYIDNAPTITPEYKTCKTCKHYLYAFEGYPCVHCQRNFKLVDEIREQKNDLWKDGTTNG